MILLISFARIPQNHTPSLLSQHLVHPDPKSTLHLLLLLLLLNPLLLLQLLLLFLELRNDLLPPVDPDLKLINHLVAAKDLALQADVLVFHCNELVPCFPDEEGAESYETCSRPMGMKC